MKSFAVCLQIDTESYNRVCQLDQLTCNVCGNPIQSGNGNTRAKVTMLYFNQVAILEVNLTEIKAYVTLFACCCFYITIS